MNSTGISTDADVDERAKKENFPFSRICVCTCLSRLNAVDLKGTKLGWVFPLKILIKSFKQWVHAHAIAKLEQTAMRNLTWWCHNFLPMFMLIVKGDVLHANVLKYFALSNEYPKRFQNPGVYPWEATTTNFSSPLLVWEWLGGCVFLEDESAILA